MANARSWRKRLGIGLLAASVFAVGWAAARWGIGPYYWPARTRVKSGAIAPPNPGPWYKGDLHAHSLFSDGVDTVSSVMAEAEDAGLDFFCLTDHDNWFLQRGVPRQWTSPQYASSRMTLLYGMEWTTARGHAGIWAAQPFDYTALWQDNRRADPDAALRDAHAQHALFSINHPNDAVHWQYDLGTPPDALEVWHGAYHAAAFTRHGIWDQYLRAGAHVTGVGGSDVHSLDGSLLLRRNALERNLGCPTTWVRADTRDAASLLAAIAAGHVSISNAPDGPRLEFSAVASAGQPAVVMGDTLGVQEAPAQFSVDIVESTPRTAAGGSGPIEISKEEVDALRSRDQELDQVEQSLAQKGLDAFDLITVYKDGELWRAAALPVGLNHYTFADSPRAPGYYRVEMLRAPCPGQNGPHRVCGVTAMSNPIYVQGPAAA